MTPVIITAGAPHLVGLHGYRDDTAGVVYIGPTCDSMGAVFTQAVLTSKVTVEAVRTGKAAQTVKDTNVDAFAT